jgi:hypothetical protein
VDLSELGCENVNWIELAEDVFVNMVMNCCGT